MGRTVVYGPSSYGVQASLPVRVESAESSGEESSGKVVRVERRQEVRKERHEVVSKSQSENLGPPEGEARGPAAAKVVVHLPAGAKLTVNKKACQATSATRTFVSPPLEPGKDYYYTLKAELVRDGQTLTSTQRIAVRAGEEKQVLLEFPTARVAQQ
jgi:uncharacterized protein (TIGR03000 family)